MRWLLLTPLVLAAAGCAVTPPAVQTPAVAAAYSLSLPSSLPGADAAANEAWWQQFNDPVLDELIREALERNRDVAAAVQSLREARALYRVAESAGLPQIEARGSVARDRMSENNRIPVRTLPNPVTLYQAGFDASWELDVFGRIAAGRDAARAAIDQAAYDREAVRVSIAAEVAAAYVRLRGAQARLASLGDQLQVARETIDLVSARARAGLVSEFDVLRAREVLANLAAREPLLEASAEIEKRRLGVLTGGQADSLLARLAPRGALPAAAVRVPATLPASLLASRADLRAIEAAVRAEAARVAEREADEYPRLSAGLALGVLSIATGNLATAASTAWNAGLAASVPVYNGGRYAALTEAQRAAYARAAIRYEAAVAQAVEEVEAAAVQLDRESRRQERLLAAVRADEDIRDLALTRYGAGLADFLTVLDAQRQLFYAQDEEIQSRERRLTHLIALHKALGGSWEAAPAAVQVGSAAR